LSNEFNVFPDIFGAISGEIELQCTLIVGQTMKTHETYELHLQFGSDEPTDLSQFDSLARQLNEEFRQANIASELPVVNAPVGTKSGFEVAVGAILVKVAPTLLPLVLQQLKKFIARSPDHSIKAKVQLGDKSIEVEYPTAAAPSEHDVAILVEKLTGTIARE
jgi:hypothetical protein